MRWNRQRDCLRRSRVAPCQFLFSACFRILLFFLFCGAEPKLPVHSRRIRFRQNIFADDFYLRLFQIYTRFIQVTAIAPGPIWHATLRDSGPSTMSYPGKRFMTYCFHSFASSFSIALSMDFFAAFQPLTLAKASSFSP